MEIQFRLRAGYDSRDMQLVLTRASYPRKGWEFCGRDKNAYCVPALHGGATLPRFKTKHQAELWAIDNRLPAFAVWNGRKRSYDGQGAIIRADAPPRDMEAEQAASMSRGLKFPFITMRGCKARVSVASARSAMAKPVNLISSLSLWIIRKSKSRSSCGVPIGNIAKRSKRFVNFRPAMAPIWTEKGNAMKISVWHDSAGWRVTSYGNGTAFEIINKEAKRSLFFQGDDALEFLSEFETHRQRLSVPDSLLVIWGDYATISQEWSEAA